MIVRSKTTIVCALMVLLLFPVHACSQAIKHYKVTNVKGSMITIDSRYDKNPDTKALAILKPYQQKVHKLMAEVIGTCEMKMDRLSIENPEGLLSNLIADILRIYGEKKTGHPCDIGLINRGGIRTILAKGPITVADLYEITPFENTLCVLTLNGTQLKSLLQNIAYTRGQGVSGVKMVITKDGKLVNATINGKEIDDAGSYRLATINYLAEGNDGLTTLARKEIPRINFDELTMRDLFIEYVKIQTAAGKMITSRMEGRITYAR